MRALITAGGRGTRLRPLTHTSNKHLIPIANKPMIHYALEAVAAAGIRDVGIVINPDTGDDIRKGLGDGSRFGLAVTYVMQEAPLGLAHVIRAAEAYLQHEPFVFFLGDNVVVGGIRQFVERFQARKDHCHLVLARVREPQRFGVAEVRGDRIVRVVEKPTQPPSDFAVTGIYVYDTPIFEAVHAIRPSARGELEISDAHQYLLEHGYQVGFSEITGWWKDTGKPEDLLEANRFALDHLLDGVGPVVRGYRGRGERRAGQGGRGGRSARDRQPHPGSGHHRRGLRRGAKLHRPLHGAGAALRHPGFGTGVQHPLRGYPDPGRRRADRAEPARARGAHSPCPGRPKTQRFVLADQSIIELC